MAAYSFNEGVGGSTADCSGNNLTGTVQGATWTNTGQYGNALNFNGTTNYVDLGNPALLQTTGSMSWSAWIRASSNPADDGNIIAKSNNSAGWQFKTTPDTGPQTFGIQVTGATGVFTQRYSNTVRLLNVWYHVAAVYNSTSQTLDIYVNGVLDNGTLRGVVPTSQVIPAVNVNIGRRSDGFNFAGTIDNVRIYNRALSAAEIVSDRRYANHLWWTNPDSEPNANSKRDPDGDSNTDADADTDPNADGYANADQHLRQYCLLLEPGPGRCA